MNYQYWQEISFYLNEMGKEKTLFGKSAITAETIDSTRKKIVSLLDQLKASLEQKLDKNHTSLVLFAIVAGIDEEMQGFDYNHLKVRWLPLQKDFYSAYTAGEVFFKSIDEILDDPKIPSIVYEVFYYILSRGFQGKYRDSKTQISKYLELLKDKIPVIATNIKAESNEISSFNPKKQRLKKWHYYALASNLFILIFLSLYLISNWD